MPSRLVITFLPRSKHLLISWLQSPSAVILEALKIKSDTVSTVSPSISHEVMRPDAMILVFWMLSFSQLFHSPLTFIKRLFSFSSLSAIRVVSSTYLRLLIFLPRRHQQKQGPRGQEGLPRLSRFAIHVRIIKSLRNLAMNKQVQTNVPQIIWARNDYKQGTYHVFFFLTSMDLFYFLK